METHKRQFFNLIDIYIWVIQKVSGKVVKFYVGYTAHGACWYL
jgi:hypothetical protein